MKVVPCTPWMLAPIHPQPGQLPIPLPTAEAMIRQSQAWALLDEGYRATAAAGFMPDGDGDAWCWAQLSIMRGPELLALTREVRRSIAASGYGQVVTLTRRDWPQAVRWARLLGFSWVGPAEVAGHDYGGWAR